MDKQEVGKIGESLATKYLDDNGYAIVDRNFEFRKKGIKYGELDIVAKKDDIFVFVEVKTSKMSEKQKARGNASGFLPQDRVSFKKKKYIIKTAEFWLAKNKMPMNTKWRIDVIGIQLDFQTRKARLTHIKEI